MTAAPAKCSKLKIRIYFDSTIFQAGGNLFGRMEVTATSSRSLKLGEIAVELAAYEEITSKEFTATQSFLSSRLCFQGPGIPPSNAVHGPCDEDGFWMAKKGKTTFPFAFQLPLDCPSSLVFGQTASLRYVVTGLVQVFYHGRDETILKSKEAFVVEAWDGYNPDYRLPIQAANSTKLFWGGSGALELEAMLAERLHSAGGNLTVEVKVKNNTSRKVQGIRVGVARRLEMVSDKAKAELNPGLKIETVSVSEVIGTQEFKSSSYLFDTGEDRTMTVNMIVPGNARTIRGTALFEVTCFVVVSMLLGAFSGELSVEIPVKICHPASLTPAPKPKLDQNHLPHHYNIVDDDLDLDGDEPTRSNRRIGSNASLAAPITGGCDSNGNVQQSGHGRDRPWGSDGQDQQDDGRQGEWNADDRGLSPANSITSIKSLLASPKQKLSKLADKIQRSTNPTSSSHLQHEHRKDADNFGVSPSRRMAKSPPLGPAVPIAYVPAVERVRYTPFQPPPTTKAKEFLKAAALYQQEMSFGALSGLGGGDNVEFNLDDKTMATAIHQWISKKESEGRYQSQAPLRAPTATRPTPPIQIPTASPNRRRHPVEPINTQVGSFTSQISPGGASPQSYYSPASPEPSSPTAAAFSNQTTSRFIHHAHRQPAAPQTEAFGSAVEDCMTSPPLFARPLPLPSPPPTGSPKRPGLPSPPVQARPISPPPVNIPIQTPESLALAKEAYERVKRAGSPVPDPLQNATTPRNSAPLSGFASAPRTSSLEQSPNIKVPIPVNPVLSSNIATSPSELSRLLNDPSPQFAHHVKHGYDGHLIDNAPPPTCSSPELRHIPLKRPLPVPGPKPPHLNQPSPAKNPSGSNPNILMREAETRSRPEPAPRPLIAAPTTTSSGHLRGPQPVVEERTTRSGHLGDAYVPKPTPTLAARPPAPVTVAMTRPGQPSNSTSKPSVSPAPAPPRTAGHVRKPVAGQETNGSGFVYPKATRKPVSGVKPAVAAKPKNLASSQSHPNDPTGSDRSAASRPMDAAAHRELDWRLRRQPQDTVSKDRTPNRDVNLAPTASMRAPQVIAVSSSSPPLEDVQRSVSPRGERRTHVTRGFQAPREATVEKEPSEAEVVKRQAIARQRGLVEVLRNDASQESRHRHDQQQHHSHQHRNAQGSPQDVSNTPVNQTVDDGLPQETSNEIRAQAIAAANSFRAKGANSGGYVVNTDKLRQVIRDSDGGTSGGGGSGHLMQALADGAMSAASAAASGLGWVQQSAPSKPTAPVAAQRTASTQPQHHHHRPGQNLQRSSSPPAHARPARQQHQHQAPPKPRHDRTPGGGGGRSSHQHSYVVEQAHDLTMKDIHFQTLSPGEYEPVVVFDPLPPTIAPVQPAAISPSSTAAIVPATVAAAPTTETTIIPVVCSQHREYEQTRSQHQVRVTQRTVADENQQQRQSRSQPASRVLGVSPRNDPLPPTPVAVAVEAHPDPVSAPSSTASELSPLRLDKTLPKIQEQPASRSRVFEQQCNGQGGGGVEEASPSPTRSSETESSGSAPTATAMVSVSASASASASAQAQSKTAQRTRYGRATATSATSGATAITATGPFAASAAPLGGGGGGAKAINPKLQEYIQKYNLAANTRP
ncbi:hypothetical protein BGX29_011625 [Mortierella sp. GBA35]|nr:hypothetical protein BGX29_011625 [Mortierella sp. GBA35]